MASEINFDTTFAELTGYAAFPWQRKWYEHLVAGEYDKIATSSLPTGLGKTSVLALWLIARANNPSLPRRLVYVVNRRTVVDQTTLEAEKLRERAEKAGLQTPAISTLRGQYADNREWSADPSKPAIICGTVDMIGSRLLFSGYGCGFKSRPLQAGFLGQDSLLIHDEAHLEPAFQKLIENIETEQRRCKEFGHFHVIELTATGRGKGEPFKLSEEDKQNESVKKRIHAAKMLHLKPLEEKVPERLAAKALDFKDKNYAVLVFARTVEDVMSIAKKLPEGRVETLTGTMRGKERDDLVTKEIFKRFLPDGQSDGESTYLVCTSAGEVGVNISADHLVCDLSTFDSMAQRFGRVNRFGKRTDTEIHVLYSTASKDADYQRRLEKTLELLRELNRDASPAALGELDATRRVDAFAPTPTILPTSEILFDAWALTTIKGNLPGRPDVEPYLHGLPTEWQPPETHVAWRQEVSEISGDLLAEYAPAELLCEYPLKPHELLREPSYRAVKELEKLAKQHRETKTVWLLDDDGSVAVLTLAELVNGDAKAKTERIAYKTVILPPCVGGLEGGMLSGASPNADDVADEWFLKNQRDERVRQRKRIWNNAWDAETEPMHEVVTIRFPGPKDDEDAEGKIWHWLRLTNEGDRGTKKPVLWDVHVQNVEDEITKLVGTLPLCDELRIALKHAAKYHDHGKRRALFQRVLGNTNPKLWLAKSGKNGNRFQEKYRHEFGSLLDIELELESLKLGEHQDLILHLIAAHHGYGRVRTFHQKKHSTQSGSQADAERIASEVPRRFARLQRKYGRWGLAYLESLLRAADWAASANPSEYYEEGK